MANVQLVPAAKIATGCESHTSHGQLYTEVGWIKLSDHREENCIAYHINQPPPPTPPQYLNDILQVS